MLRQALLWGDGRLPAAPPRAAAEEAHFLGQPGDRPVAPGRDAAQATGLCPERSGQGPGATPGAAAGVPGLLAHPHGRPIPLGGDEADDTLVRPDIRVR